MIVIATNNGKAFLQPLLKSFEGTHGIEKENILIVDTGSDEEDSIEYLNELNQTEHLNKLNIQYYERKRFVRQTPYKGYDTGAYLYAFELFPFESKYIFLHDSMLAKDPEWLNIFKSKITDEEYCPWLTFPLFYDQVGQEEFVSALGNPYRGIGIFGPIFGCSNRAMKTITAYYGNKFYPKNKIEQMAMERGWGVIFNELGFIPNPIGDLNDADMNHFNTPLFNKFKPYRL